jgi:hypothetical protein
MSGSGSQDRRSSCLDHLSVFRRARAIAAVFMIAIDY